MIAGCRLRGLPDRRRPLFCLGPPSRFFGLALAAVEAAPRKTSAAETVAKGPYFRTGMAVSGVGGLLAMVGATWLVLNLCWPGSRCLPPAGRTHQD